MFTLNAEKTDCTQQQKAARSRLTKIFDNQKRLRENIISLEKVKNPDKLMSRYLTNLEQHENEITDEQNKMEDLQQEITVKTKTYTDVCNQIKATANNMMQALSS